MTGTRSPPCLALASLAIALLGAGCAAGPNAGAGAGDHAAIVSCYDAVRDVVTSLPAALCHGEIVDAHKAAELEAARSLRIQAAARQLQAGAATAGRRLAGSGTGLLVGPDGEVLTNDHVIESCAVVSVSTADGTNMPARVRVEDGEEDLALLASGLRGTAVAVFNRTPGTASPFRLAVIGFPQQDRLSVLSSLTPAAARAQDLASSEPAFLVAGSVRPGHSGSPLVDQSGNVVGLMRAKVDSAKVYRRTGQLVDDIGLAISNTTIFAFLAAHDVPIRAETSSEPLSDEAILAKARLFVVRVNCWR